MTRRQVYGLIIDCVDADQFVIDAVEKLADRLMRTGRCHSVEMTTMGVGPEHENFHPVIRLVPPDTT